MRCSHSCSPAAPRRGRPDSLDAVARDYVKLQLAVGEEEDYVDAYYGPPEWQAEAKLKPRSLPDLAARAGVLAVRLRSVADSRLEPIERRRRDFLLANLRAASTRLRMIQGEKLAFETAALYPPAGLPTAGAAQYLALQGAIRDLAGARFTIAADYLDGRIDRPRAVELTRKYQLVSPARADKSVAFIDQYRSYVIDYGLGLDYVRTYVESFGEAPERRWAAMASLLSGPTLPSDLVVP